MRSDIQLRSEWESLAAELDELKRKKTRDGTTRKADIKRAMNAIGLEWEESFRSKCLQEAMDRTHVDRLIRICKEQSLACGFPVQITEEEGWIANDQNYLDFWEIEAAFTGADADFSEKRMEAYVIAVVREVITRFPESLYGDELRYQNYWVDAPPGRSAWFLADAFGWDGPGKPYSVRGHKPNPWRLEDAED